MPCKYHATFHPVSAGRGAMVPGDLLFGWPADVTCRHCHISLESMDDMVAHMRDAHQITF
jgi:hypothetical protein